MPVVFVGHGNPMHALHDNAYTRALARLGKEIERPRGIVCISAHWMTKGSWATHMPHPRTIHDFHGFPQELFEIQYPAPGSPEIAKAVRDTAPRFGIKLDDENWGLDHGAWAVLKHMYPKANIPVIQLSLDINESSAHHLALGQALAPLRDDGILILGSGNIVHNLAQMDWSDRATPLPWAVKFDGFVKTETEAGNVSSLSADPYQLPGGRESVPTPEHWYPFLYCLSAAAGDPVRWEYEGLENASISMRCASFGLK